MVTLTRRTLLQASIASAAACGLGTVRVLGQVQPPQTDAGLRVLNPRGRVPASFFIDDSTCLVNMGRFCMPQFAQAWPEQSIYKRPWKTWPAEIPDAFLREFGTFCAENGVKGKFSIVPNPACVGWLDREIPGWSRSELLDSLKLVRELMVPHWDIHPEMITHTRVIDLKTGRPMEQINSGTMENSFPQSPRSVDELAAYLAYALQILKNCELPCEGITTPGGFGNRVKSELSLAVQQAVGDVFKAEIPHYFKYVSEGKKETTEPKIEHLSDALTDHPRLTVNVPAGTGDWFGGWDGDREPEGHLYCNADATAGRMVELIENGQPAVMLCHWPGLYNHGKQSGFEQFKAIVKALHGRFADRMQWMKISQIARYWAAKELTRVTRDGAVLTLAAPFECPAFTVQVKATKGAPPVVMQGNKPIELKEVPAQKDLASGTWRRDKGEVVVCFDLTKGRTRLEA